MVLNFGTMGLNFQTKIQGSGTAFELENGKVKSVTANSPNFSSILDSAYLFTSQIESQMKYG